jgi:4-hydroxy-2-oxoheptanedioate aldolase
MWTQLEASVALRTAWEGGRPTFGAWSAIGNTFAVELLGRAGFDWICIDTQHGLVATSDVPSMLQTLTMTRTPAFVRVPSNSPPEIMRALDAGAAGVVVPMINSADDARVAASACRYPPAGIRSWGPARAALGVASYTPQVADSAAICVVMVETAQAVEQIDAIATTPGVDAVFVGPRDLALSYGQSLTIDDATLTPHILSVRDACRNAGIVSGIHGGTIEAALSWARLGFCLVAITADSVLLASSASELVSCVRQAVGHPDRRAK